MSDMNPNSLTAIPAELRAIPQWHHWKLEIRDGKPTKVPKIAGEARNASSTDPATWTTFDNAVAKLNGDGRGLGWTLTEPDGIVFIDLDHSVDVQTGQIAPWAQRIMARIGSYAERSPNDGIHIFIRGKLPGKGNKVGRVEMYSSRRFATITGHRVLGAPETIQDVDISWLHRLMVAGVFDFKHDPRLEALMAGDFSAYPSQSEADLALASLLARKGLGFDDIAVAVELSALFDEKWQRTDYREQTVHKALEGKFQHKRVVEIASEANWQKGLLRGKDGGPPLRLLANACIALREAPELKGLLAYDEFAGVTATLRPAPWRQGGGIWGEDDDRHLAEWLQVRGIGVNSNIAAEAAETVAREHPFHPVKQYLESLIWDGIERTDLWMPCCLGTEDTPYTRAVGSRILVAAAARIYEPGCQCDSLPVLQGPQGILKSSVIRELFSTPWFTDHISDLHSKDARLELRGRWCIEISELSAVRRGEIEAVKAFLSCRSDNFRPPYGHRRIDVPRSCVFFGTTNDSTPFTDPTGSRRFWPVRCGVIDLEAVRRNRGQLWAEALVRYRRGDPRYLETPELTALAREAQAQFYEPGSRDDLIEKWIENPTQRTPEHTWDDALPWFGSEPGKINATDVLVHGLGLTKAQIRPGDSREVGRCLKHLGYECSQERSGPHRGRRYYTKREGES